LRYLHLRASGILQKEQKGFSHERCNVCSLPALGRFALKIEDCLTCFDFEVECFSKHR
jgi:hypothetical protein